MCMQVLASALGVSSGLAMGKEGPMLHAGSIVAVVMGSNKWMQQQMQAVSHWGVYTYNKELRDLVAVGVACGVTTAFKAPVGVNECVGNGCGEGELDVGRWKEGRRRMKIEGRASWAEEVRTGRCLLPCSLALPDHALAPQVGGVLFAMEISTRWRKDLTWRCFLAAAITVVVVRSAIQICSGYGACYELKYGSLIFFNVRREAGVKLREESLEEWNESDAFAPTLSLPHLPTTPYSSPSSSSCALAATIPRGL
jgi:hypothetical protein